jgi:HAD superfamily hydrolase (TIGR01450 family)
MARYRAIRPRLPKAAFPATSRHCAHLGVAAEEFDVIVLDAFGVLNIGDSAIPGAVARMAQLRAAGKRLIVLTNAASYGAATALAKYRAFGFDFTDDEVVSSRDVALAALSPYPAGWTWATIGGPSPDPAGLTMPTVDIEADPGALDRADAILFLSGSGWTRAKHEALVAALAMHPRPMVVANPDLVAPRETGLTVEPGWWAHDIADRTGIVPAFFGKPFPDAFDMVRTRFPKVPTHRFVMVGDTLHTDVLGGRAAGFGTVLITDHGLLKGRDIAAEIEAAGIVPDFIAPTT